MSIINLIIVESPAKCKKIENILGKNYKCIASFGHINELNSLDLIDFNNFENNVYKIIKSKKKYIDNLKNNIEKTKKNNGEIIIATDNDREGEAIGFHICNLCNLSIYNTKRIIFNEITKTSLIKAIQEPTYLNIDIVNSQQSRQILDLCVGFKVSPLLWKYVNYKSSAGRCQTPTLKLIYERENEVLNYLDNPQFIWNIFGEFGNKKWIFNLINYENILIDKDLIIDFLDKCKNYNFICNKKDFGTNYEKKYPPIPLITSTLQQICNKNYNLSSKITMKIAQELYESGLITYMRTDSTNMSMEFIKNVEKYINTTYGDNFVSNNYNDRDKNKSKQKSQEAHECIRVTDPFLNCIKNFSNKITPIHEKIYNLIWKTSIQTIMKPSLYKILELHVNTPINNIYFKYKHTLIHYKGYEIIDYDDKKYNESLDEYNYIQYYLFNDENVSGINISNKYILCENKIKNHPKLYNESDVIKNIEKLNIGRPSTFSSIVQNIETKNFVSKEKEQFLKKYNKETIKFENQNINCETNEIDIIEYNKYKVTEKGIKILEFCYNYFNELFNYNYTNIMENDLDLIANGSKTKKDVCRQVNNDLDKVVNNIKIDTKNNDYKVDLKQNRVNIGKYDKKSIYLCNGKYGYFLEYNKKTFSIDKNLDIHSLTLEFAINIIIKQINEKNKLILREIDENISIRQSKYGEYIYYKTKNMKTPLFIPIDNFTLNILECKKDEIINYVNNYNVNNKKKYNKYSKYKKYTKYNKI